MDEEYARLKESLFLIDPSRFRGFVRYEMANRGKISSSAMFSELVRCIHVSSLEFMEKKNSVKKALEEFIG